MVGKWKKPKYLLMQSTLLIIKFYISLCPHHRKSPVVICEHQSKCTIDYKSYVFKEPAIAIKKQFPFSIPPVAGCLCETETTITVIENKTGKGREVRKKREENTPSAT